MEILSTVSGLLFILGYVPYTLGVIRGQTKPVRIGWIIWAILDGIALVAMHMKGAANGQIVGATFGATLIALLSVRYGIGGWGLMEKLCSALAIVGIMLWLVLDNPTAGILISLGLIVMASVPTFRSAWEDPTRENKAGWTMFTLSCLCTLPAIQEWTLESAAQPVTFTGIELTMMYLLYIRPRFKKRAP